MRIALGIEYNGAPYYGWQRQKEVNSVQQELETALSHIANEKIVVQCAGRTDAGVHATGQVVHFDVTKTREIRAWTLGVNAKLPDPIAVKWATNVSDEFHARYSATARRYRYVIYNNQLRSGILPYGVTHCHAELDAEKMHQAAQVLVGEHDFSAFRATHCQSKSPVRSLSNIVVYRQGQYVVIDVKANAFLHHMVRNITGTLMEVGKGEQPVGWVQEILALKDRTQAGVTAKPNGLYMVHVAYPESFNLPSNPALGPLFLENKDF